MDDFVINREVFTKADKIRQEAATNKSRFESLQLWMEMQQNKCFVCGKELDSDYQFFEKDNPNAPLGEQFRLICSNCVPKSNSVKAITDTKEKQKLNKIYLTKQNQQCFYCGKNETFEETFVVYPFFDSEKRLACLSCNNETPNKYSLGSRDYYLIRDYSLLIEAGILRKGNQRSKWQKQIIRKFVLLYYPLIQKWERTYKNRLDKASKHSGINFEYEMDTIYDAACEKYFDDAINASLNRDNVGLEKGKIPPSKFSMMDYFDGYLRNAVRDKISDKIKGMKFRNKNADNLLNDGKLEDSKSLTPEQELERKEFEELKQAIIDEISSKLSKLQKQVFDYKIRYLPRYQRDIVRALNLSKDQVFRAWQEIEYWEKKVCEVFGYSDVCLTSKERLAEIKMEIDRDIVESLSEMENKVYDYTKTNELYKTNDIVNELNLSKSEVQAALKKIKKVDKEVHKKYLPVF